MVISLAFATVLVTTGAGMGQIGGTVTLPEGSMVAAESELVFTLQSTGTPGATVLVEKTISAQGLTWPLDFGMLYPEEAVNAQASYVLTAQLREGGVVTMTSAEPISIDWSDTNAVDVQMRIAREAPVEQTPTFEDTLWVLSQIGGQQIPWGDVPPATLSFDGESGFLNGFSGINQFTGAYSYEDGWLQIDPSATNLAAGPVELQAVENEFLNNLWLVNRVTVEGSEMRLQRGDTVLATFVRSEN